MASAQPLKLYKQMLRESQKFTDFNFRHYALRRVRDGFKAGKNLPSSEMSIQLKVAEENLQMIKRQTTISQLFNPGVKLSIEKSDFKN